MYGQAKPDEDSALKRMLGMLDLISPTVIGQLALSWFRLQTTVWNNEPAFIPLYLREGLD